MFDIRGIRVLRHVLGAMLLIALVLGTASVALASQVGPELQSDGQGADTATNTPTNTPENTPTNTPTLDVATEIPTSTSTPDCLEPDDNGECNPQIDAEVNIAVECVTLNQDGTYTIGGAISVLNQSEHDQDIRITDATAGLTPGSADLSSIELAFEGQVILQGATLSYPFQVTLDAGADPGAQFTLSFSVLFESVQGRGTVAEPREDAEEFFLDAKDSCTPGQETPSSTATEPVGVETEAPSSTPTSTATEDGPPLGGVTEEPTEELDDVAALPSTGVAATGAEGAVGPIFLLTLIAIMALGVGWRVRAYGRATQ